jgi:hypothetical protein
MKQQDARYREVDALITHPAQIKSVAPPRKASCNSQCTAGSRSWLDDRCSKSSLNLMRRDLRLASSDLDAVFCVVNIENLNAHARHKPHNEEQEGRKN